jgi:hypothetical protein
VRVLSDLWFGLSFIMFDHSTCVIIVITVPGAARPIVIVVVAVVVAVSCD